jgi:hypothetical protein
VGRTAGFWVIIGVPLLALVSVAWQLGTQLFHTEITIHDPAAIARISLEPDARGARVDLVMVDRTGTETTGSGTLSVKVREPDGALWQTTRNVSSADFAPLPSGGLLAGRTGLSLVVPAADWARPPRHGGTASVTVELDPAGGSPPIAATSAERFP